MNLELSDTQARVVINALDVYSRIGMLQIDAVAFLIGDLGLHQNPWQVADHFDAIKHELFGLPRGASHSIGNPLVPAPCKIAYDIQCVIRKDIAERERSDSKDFKGYNVWLDEPLHTFKSEPLAKVTQ